MDQRGIPPDGYTYASLLQTCFNIRFIAACKLVHDHIILTRFEPDISSKTKLVTMYAKCGKSADARRALERMAERDVISWTAMISAYSQHGHDEKALELFYQMQNIGVRPDNFTFATVLIACAQMGALEQRKEVHESIIRSEFLSNVFVGFGENEHQSESHKTTVEARPTKGGAPHVAGYGPARFEPDISSETKRVTIYAKCGKLVDAWRALERMAERDVISWTAMISTYSQHGHDEKALELFYQMQNTGV
eukprot:PITA_04746